jgi:chemotaxis protein MotB
LLLSLSRDGLRIQIVDTRKAAMFAIGIDHPYPYAKAILKKIEQFLGTVPNMISITGHTDARPMGETFRVTGVCPPDGRMPLDVH